MPEQSRSPFRILLKPRITEKASASEGTRSSVVFEVPLDASKIEVRKAVEEAFNVDVHQVRTMIVRGKIKRRGRFIGKRSNYKKAIVTLAEGQDVDLFGTTV
jgi:large subunit ribosomal protein L23